MLRRKISKICLSLAIAFGFGISVNKQVANADEITYVAQIGETKYATVAAAISAWNEGNEIELLSDASCSVSISTAVVFKTSDYALTMDSKKKISNGTFGCKVVSTTTTSSSYYTSGGTFNNDFTGKNTISNGTFNGNVVSSSTISGGTFNGTVTSTSSISSGTFNNPVYAKTISGGTFHSTVEINVEGGSISGGIFDVDPIGTIKDGFVKLANSDSSKYLVTKSEYVENNKVVVGSFAKYQCVSEFADSTTHTVLTANASKDYVVLTEDLDQDSKLYKGIYSFSMSGVFADGYSCTSVKEYGETGYVYFYVVGKNVIANSSDNYNITSGMFNMDVSRFVDTTSYEVINNSGIYTVSIKESAIVAMIGDNKYPSLAKAFSALQNNDIIKLVKDVEGNIEYWNYSGVIVTLDLNGHKITSTSGTTLKIIGNGTKVFTIKDSSENGSIEAVDTALFIGAYGTSSSGKPIVKIESGVFKGTTALNVTGKSSYMSTATVEGGYFNGAIVKGSNSTLTLKGGNYTVDPSTINPTFPSGYGVSEDELSDYPYSVGEITYIVSVGTSTHGSVLVNGKTSDEVKAGSEVIFTCVADADYKLQTYLIDGVAIDGDTYTVNKDCTVTATFVAKDYVIQNTTTLVKYEDITEAAKDAKSGETIKLIRSCNFSESVYLNNFKWKYSSSFENITFDLNNKTLYLTGAAKLEVTGKNITIKRGTINVTHNYAIYTGCYSPDGIITDKTTITISNLTMNGGVNMSQTDLVCDNCKIDVTSKEYYCFWLDSFNETPNDLVINSGSYKTALTRPIIACGNESQTATIYGGEFNQEIDESMIADGYSLVDGKVTFIFIKNVDTGVSYDNVADALNAAKNNETIQLLSDIELNGLADVNLNGKKVTLDLNGKTWKFNNETTAQQQGIRFTGTGDFIITGGSMIYDDEYGSCRIIDVNVSSSVNITVKDATITSTGSSNTIVCGGNLVVENSTISSASVGGSFTLTSGTISYVTLNDSSTVATINGGTISKQLSLPNTNGATITVNGGTINNIATANSSITGSTVYVNDGATINWLQNNGTNYINGGTITSINGGTNIILAGNFADLYYHNNSGTYTEPLTYRDVSYTISGGNFTKTAYITDSSTARNISEDLVGNYELIYSESLQAYVATKIEYSVVLSSILLDASGDKLSDAVAKIIGGGKYDPEANVNIACSLINDDALSNINFIGWYLKTGNTLSSNPVCDDQNYTISSLSANVCYVAVYQVKEVLGSNPNLTLKNNEEDGNNKGKYTVKDLTTEASQVSENSSTKFDVGTGVAKVEISYEEVNKETVYWLNESGHIVGTGKTLTTTVLGNMILTAVTVTKVESQEHVLVRFNSDFAQVVSNISYKIGNYDAADSSTYISIPEVPSKVGYTGKGWKVGENEFTTIQAKELTAKVEEIAANNEIIDVYPVYEAKALYATVNVYLNSQVKNTYQVKLGTGIKLDLINYDITGYNFGGWKVNDVLVSYSEVYSLVPSQAETYTVDLVVSSKTVAKKATVNVVESKASSIADSKTLFEVVVSYDVPEGSQFMKSGLYYSNEKTNVTKCSYESNVTTSNGSFKLNVKTNVSTLYVQGYVVYVDENGATQIITTEVIEVK